eukprot:2018055-Pleurochrysis_carterae.AAC.1
MGDITQGVQESRGPGKELRSRALRFQHPPVLGTEHSASDVYDDVAQGKEQPRGERFGKEISK